MRKISLARTIILLFLIPFCLYLFYHIFTQWSLRFHQKPVEPPEKEKEMAKVEQFEMKGLEQDKKAFSLKAEKLTQLKEGIFLLQHIDPFILYTSQGKKIILEGEKGMMIQSNKANSKIMIEGKVVVRTEEGQELRTTSLSYDTASKEIMADHEVIIIGPAFYGTAAGMRYSLEEEKVILGPHFDFWASDKNGKIHIEAGSFEGSPHLREGSLKGGVRFHHEENEILAKEARIMGRGKSSALRKIQLFGGVRGKSYQKKAEKPSLANFQGQIMNILFNEQGELERVTIEDEVSITLEKSGKVPRKTMRCDKFISYWREEQISEVSAQGNVTIEKGPMREQEFQETLSCPFLFLSFHPKGALNKAKAQGGVQFQSGSLQGHCEEAEYLSSHEEIIMKGKGDEHPYLATDLQSVQAQEICIKSRKEIFASGLVKTIYREKDGSEEVIPLFQRDKSVFISSKNLHMIVDHEAFYSGYVRAWQEDNSIEAQEIQILFPDHLFQAHGKVLSRFSSLSPEGSREEKSRSQRNLPMKDRIEVQSEDLVYQGRKRQATFEGTVIVHMRSSTMKASTIEITFSEEGQAESIKASSGIWIASQDFIAEGDLLKYSFSKYLGELRGISDPARIYSRSGKETGVAAFLTFQIGEDKIRLLSKDEGRAWMIFK